MARSSVAQILQGRPGYNAKTRQRVRETARRLGYRPNYLSKALRGGRSMSIGMIWPMRGVTGDVDVGMAVLEEVRRHGYATYQDESRNDAGALLKAVEDLAARQADALVLWLQDNWSEALGEALRAFSTVLIVSSEDKPEFGQDLVIYDRYRAIERVADHFAETGRRRPGIVLHDVATQRPKIDRFLDRCRRRGMEVGERSLINLRGTALEPGLVGMYQATYQAHFRDGVDVDAILCGTDQGAMTAIRYFRDRGLRVPEDVAVVGWNHLSIGAIWTPALASIDRRRDELAGAMCELLLSRLESPDRPGRRRTVHMEFVKRESAGNLGSMSYVHRRSLCEG